MIADRVTVLHNTADVLLSTVLPTIVDPHTRAVVLQLAAVARHAALQGEDATSSSGPDAADSAALLVAAMVSTDADLLAQAAARRAELIAELDAALQREAPLIEAFRGRMPT